MTLPMVARSMATVVIPSLLGSFCGGRKQVRVSGATLGQVLNNLDAVCPGILGRLVVDGDLVPEMAAAIDGELALLGLRSPVGAESEIVFLPAVSGG